MFYRPATFYGGVMTDKKEEMEILKKKISDHLRKLSYREREIIKMRYGLADGYLYTLVEIAATFGVTSERIRQIEKEAIRKLMAESSNSA